MIEPFNWDKSEEFYNRVEYFNLHGLHFQHIELCHRRAWMYLHKVNFAQWYSKVQKGTALHDSSYQRDHSVRGLIGLSPDRIDWANYIVYENKGSGGAIEASFDQTAFYAVILSIVTRKKWRAYTHILTTKRKKEVVIDNQRLEKLWCSSITLENLAKQDKVPAAQRIGLCKSCSLAMFCGYD